MHQEGDSWIVENEEDLRAVAKAIMADMMHFKIFLLNGAMGSGKTTLMKILGDEIGLEDEVSSPTFSIVNEYRLQNPKGGLDTIYHMDLYRLEDPDELFEIGFVEYLDSGKPLFIEWPEIAIKWYEGTEALIEIEALDNGNRKIRILPYDAIEGTTWVTK